MDRDQLVPQEPKEYTHPDYNTDDTETDSEYESCSERGAAATNTPDISESSSSKAISKEEFQKVLEEITPQMGLRFKLTSVSEYIGAEVNPHSTAVPLYFTRGGIHKSPKSIQIFLSERFGHLRKLKYDMKNVKEFMNKVITEVGDGEPHGPVENLMDVISDKWSIIFGRWEIVRSYLENTMRMTEKMMNFDKNELTITDIEMYIDCVSLLQTNLHELAEFCYDSPRKYKLICEKYVDYLFMFCINDLPARADELNNRLTEELDEFVSYYHEPDFEYS